MRFFLTRTQGLCRLILAVWCVVFAFSVLAGCGAQDASLGQISHGLVQSIHLHVAHPQAGQHGAVHDQLCGQLCQNLSAPMAKVDVGAALLPVLLLGLTLWGLSACLWLVISPSRCYAGLSPFLTGGSPPRPHLLFQRFNN